MFSMFLYCDSNEVDFEKVIPLKVQGQYFYDNKIKNIISIYFLSGYDRLSTSYKNQLIEYGYKIFNKEKQTTSIEKKFPNISNFRKYDKYCYLRWLLFKKLVDTGEIRLPSIAIDGDLFLVTSLNKLYEYVKGMTFLIQGCPCFLVVSNYDWFLSYEKELVQLDKSPMLYNEKLKNPIMDDNEYCNSSEYKVPLRHDQDFLEYLIAAGLIRQEKSINIYNLPFYWMENPLFPQAWSDAQGGFNRVEEKGFEFFIGEKIIPFIHMQSNFSWYCYEWLTLYKWNIGFIAKHIKGYDKHRNPSTFNHLFSTIIRNIDRSIFHYSREFVCKIIFKRRKLSKNMFITEILNIF